jgi:tRNA pseudouridine55 synthase
MTEDERHARLLPTEALLAEHTRVTLGAEDARRFTTGLSRRGTWADAEQVVVFGTEPACVLGTARVADGALLPTRLLSPPEIQQILESRP